MDGHRLCGRRIDRYRRKMREADGLKTEGGCFGNLTLMAYKISLLVTAVLLIVSAVTDAKEHKVLNALTFPSMAIGLILCGFPFTSECYARLFWMAVFFIFGSFRWMGLGDIKLIMAVTALRGVQESAGMFIMGTVILLCYCFLTDRENTIHMVEDTWHTLAYHTPVVKRSDKEYPFALFLALGYLTIWIKAVFV